MWDGAAIKKIVLGIVIGLLVGISAGYFLASQYDDSKMKEKEKRIDDLTTQLETEQAKSKDTLAKLEVIESEKKKIDQKIKGDVDELQKTNATATDAVKRLKSQVKILHKVLCDYSSDFCTQPEHGKAGAG